MRQLLTFDTGGGEDDEVLMNSSACAGLAKVQQG